MMGRIVDPPSAVASSSIVVRFLGKSSESASSVGTQSASSESMPKSCISLASDALRDTLRSRRAFFLALSISSRLFQSIVGEVSA